MHSQPSFRRNRYELDGLLALAFASTTIFTSGCGVSRSTPVAPTPPGNTTVTVLATSTANDQLSQFNLYFDTITLTSQSGKTVNLLPGYEHEEFIHLNGKSEPFFTTSVPQDTYTSATATVGPASFECFSSNSSGTSSGSFFSYGYTPPAQVTVNLPAPITVSGASEALSLDLLVSQSAKWAGAPCVSSPANSPFTISPNFSLVPSFSQIAMTGLDGMVASVNSATGSFTVTAAEGARQEVTSTGSTVTSSGLDWTVKANSETLFQGIPGVSALTAGTPVDLDATLQPDGSLMATRIAVYDTIDTNTATLSASNGPLISVYDGPNWLQYSNPPVLLAADTETEGNYATQLGEWGGAAGFSFSSAAFQTSGQLSNLQQLPFPAQFNAANAAAGQTISITFNGNNISDSTPVTTVTLMPQTINGTVTAVSSEGGFDTYTVSLAAYDLFPQLAVQTFQTTVLNNPSTVIVYADSNTQMLNTQSIAVGSVLRFNGLVFNDSGTLRMDCAQISDGVPE